MPQTLLSVKCKRDSCTICEAHQALESKGAIPLPEGKIRDGECSLTIRHNGSVRCATIFNLDQQEADYRYLVDSITRGKMCDFGILVKAPQRIIVAAIELKSKKLLEALNDQLQAGLEVIHDHIGSQEVAVIAKAVLVSMVPTWKVKRRIQTTPDFHRKTRSLSYGDHPVTFDIVECHSQWFFD